MAKHECQQRLGAGLLTHVGDLLEIAQKLLFVDEVIRRLDHLFVPRGVAGGPDSSLLQKCELCREPTEIEIAHRYFVTFGDVWSCGEPPNAARLTFWR